MVLFAQTNRRMNSTQLTIITQTIPSKTTVIKEPSVFIWTDNEIVLTGVKSMRIKLGQFLGENSMGTITPDATAQSWAFMNDNNQRGTFNIWLYKNPNTGTIYKREIRIATFSGDGELLIFDINN